MAFRLAHFTDIHITDPPDLWPHLRRPSKRLVGWANLRFTKRWQRFRDAPHIVEALVADILELDPDHVLFTGDLTSLSLDSEFHAAQRLLLPLIRRGKISGLPGNHDLYTPRAARSGLYRKLFGSWEESDLTDSPPWARRLSADLALIGVVDSRPTGLFDSSGRIGEEQLERLRRHLSDPRIDSCHRILALHYGPRLADGSPDTPRHGLRDAEHLLEVAREGGVDLIVHGHLHRRFVLPAGPATPIPIANPGSATYGGGERAYHLLEVGSNSITLSARRFDPGRGRFVIWPDAPASGLLELPGR